ncbi:hypothetical protein LEN26_000969 [Aphanomyces euteiches]|nr:hypothetical protein AeMF1_010950 [Aphanomyces euteiches]KAH9162379.1 hypothetical protein LEN26_000969 [Aphanomyces euteiches]KAH9185612.1 hypothetical protein AeNC1_012411 [Aphanomyces euteiches]
MGTIKEGRVQVLRLYDENTAAIEALVGNQQISHRKQEEKDPDDRRTEGSMFRLVNVLFSDLLFEEFMSSGDMLTRMQLEDGGNKSWVKVAEECNTDKPE